MEVCLLRTNRINVFKKKSLNLKNYDKYIFLGKNPLLGNAIESILKNKIDSIAFNKDFIKIQYEFKDDYIDFIDNSERIDFKHKWWDTRLSSKNPWISFTYFRFCQVLLVKKYLNNHKNSDIRLLLIFEENCVLSSVYEYVSKNLNCNVQKIYLNDYSKFKLVFNGLKRRVLSIPYYLYKIFTLKLIFFNFKKKDFSANNVFVFSFLDNRCFREKKFNDPFLGKFLEKIGIKRNISYIPVLHDISIKKLKIFKKWILNNNYSVTFLPFHLSLKDLFLPVLSSKFPSNVKDKFLLEINLSHLIERERLEEWSDFNIQNSLIKKISTSIKSCNQKKLIVYPFENQIWERNMLSILSKDKNSKIFGVQNAPAPKLSLRFFVSNKMIKDLPLPDRLFVTGDISYKNLKGFYGKNILIKSSSSRKILNNNSINTSLDKNIMLACSISKIESQELIIFACNSLRTYTDYNVNIVPHPLSKFNYKKFLKSINAPSHFKINEDYDYELEHCKFLLFDSSTAGIEGLLNEKIPVRVANKYMLNVNPSEYDNKITKYAYDYSDLKSIINSKDDFDDDFKQVGLKYYKYDDSKNFDKIINELKFLNYDN